MREVANVNGVSVLSDKPGSVSIRDTVVSFIDGSFVNVATGEVVNKGPGTLSMGSSSGSAGEEATRKERFFVGLPSELSLEKLNANVQVTTTQENEISVVLKGPQRMLDDIEIRQDGNAIVICGQSGDNGTTIVMGNVVSVGRGSVTRINRSFGSVFISGNEDVVVIKGGKKGSEVSIEVQIPEQTNVAIEYVNGRVSLADITGNLRIGISGVGEVRGGRVLNARVKISGAGSLSLREVMGEYLRVRVSGSGSVDVPDGHVEEIECSVSGSGNVSFGGRAENGDLDVSGVGNISVSHVVNRPSRNVSGVGSIHVGNW